MSKRFPAPAAQTSRRSFLLQAGAATAPALNLSSRKPNIILIVADDLGYGHLGCYGQKNIQTPSLDRMAAEGARLTQAYAGCTVCAPSRSSLMTGLHTGHTPIRSNSGDIPLLSGETTLAESLKAAGYRTGLFGKWGLGDAGSPGVPDKKGFDEYYGYLHQVHAHFQYPHFLWKNGKKSFLRNRHSWRQDFAHDLIERESLEFIRKNRNNPFFLYLPFTLPHAELLAPDDAMKDYGGKFPETPFTSAPRMHYAPNPTPRAALAAMVSRLDRSAGRVLNLLAELGLDRDSLVIFTSDNGPDQLNGNDIDFFQAAGPFRGHKTLMYEGGIRVPFIARWPERIKTHVNQDSVIAAWDIMPTCLELTQVPAPTRLDGQSLVGTLTQPSARLLRDRELYWEREDPGGILQAARLGRWKGVRPEVKAGVEVYDLQSDPAESRDLAQSQPEIRRKLEEFMRTSHTPPRPQIADRPTDGREYR